MEYIRRGLNLKRRLLQCKLLLYNKFGMPFIIVILLLINIHRQEGWRTKEIERIATEIRRHKKLMQEIKECILELETSQ